jgi:allantoate deiminase
LEIGELARQIMERCDTLATHSMDEGRITRPYATPALLAAREQVAAWMQEAGMTTRLDNVGNLWGRWAREPDQRTFLIGGHIDSVVDAGRYDGILGVLSGIVVVAHLRATGADLPFAVEVVAFADEEGNRFRTNLLGSASAAGNFNSDSLDNLDSDGITLRQAIVAIGGDPERIAGDALDPAAMVGFIEVHIEQGPVLEQRNLPVGVVSAITGSKRATVTLEGMAGHAGTVPMAMRRDALAGAAELVLAAEEIGRHSEGLVATVGKLEVAPGAPNVIPGQVTLTLDVRHAEKDAVLEAMAAIRARADAIVSARGLRMEWEETPGSGSTPCDPGLIARLEEAIAAEGIEALSLFSGAGHDAGALAAIMPVSMLFVRCKDGISHNPAESIDVADAEVALRVLLRFVSLVGEGEG